MLWQAAFNVFMFAMAAAVATYNIGAAVRLRRKLRRVMVLDRLLTGLAMQSFEMHHEGTFKAWADSMGSISVQVEMLRKPWSEG